MKIPFALWPYSWGLTGVDREVAKAKYYLDGEQLDIKLANLRLTGKELQRELLSINHKYGHVTDYAFEKQIAEYDFTDGIAKELYLKDVDLKYDFITQLEYDKAVATIRKQPWVNINKIELDENNVSLGNLELDWNEFFIEELHKHGFVSKDEDECVNLWLSTLCKNIALEEFAGMGSLDDLDDENETRQRTLPKKDKLDETRWEAR